MHEPADSLVTDIHNHVLPGIDDGASNLQDTLLMLEGLRELGYRKVIATPHVMQGSFPNSAGDILEALTRVQDIIKEAGLDISLQAAAEYMADEGFADELAKDSLLCFGDRMVMFECPFWKPFPGLNEYLFQLHVREYKPVLAHPERYPYWQGSKSELLSIHEREVLFQVNLGSLVGAYGPACRKTAMWLLEHDMIDLLGSDLHQPAGLDILKRALCLPSVQDLMKRGRLLNNQL